MVIVPSSAVETMGLGGMLATTALARPVALGPDAAAMFAHDGVGNRQAEPDGVS